MTARLCMDTKAGHSFQDDFPSNYEKLHKFFKSILLPQKFYLGQHGNLIDDIKVVTFSEAGRALSSLQLCWIVAESKRQ